MNIKFLSIAYSSLVCLGLLTLIQPSTNAQSPRFVDVYSLSDAQLDSESSTCNDAVKKYTFSNLNSTAAKEGLPKRRRGGGSRVK